MILILLLTNRNRRKNDKNIKLKVYDNVIFLDENLIRFTCSKIIKARLINQANMTKTCHNIKPQMDLWQHNEKTRPQVSAQYPRTHTYTIREAVSHLFLSEKFARLEMTQNTISQNRNESQVMHVMRTTIANTSN